MSPELKAEVEAVFPAFVNALRAARESDAMLPVMVPAEAFDDQPGLVYACVGFASDEGVVLCIMPEKSRRPRPS